ncbi:hypothetical protein BJV78DRAFT_1220061 [Lactifluus subvellereus]|nr:hypothetical protein BJV78DRAFT_1220061 [Lactifluus subvellereus]
MAYIDWPAGHWKGQLCLLSCRLASFHCGDCSIAGRTDNSIGIERGGGRVRFVSRHEAVCGLYTETSFKVAAGRWHNQPTEDTLQGRIFLEGPVDALEHVDAEVEAANVTVHRICPLPESRSPAVISASSLGPRSARGETVIGPSTVVLALLLISSFYGVLGWRGRKVKEVCRRSITSSSFALRSSCTSSTTTRIRSCLLKDRVRSTSRRRVTGPEGSASCNIICPGNTPVSNAIAR